MRLWSLHPSYLDVKGLGACWREALGARRALSAPGAGYRRHPQLKRFQETRDPVAYINAYLVVLYIESRYRGYNYDSGKLAEETTIPHRLHVTTGQLDYEWDHLQAKLLDRDPDKFFENEEVRAAHGNYILPAPMIFAPVAGPIESWEKLTDKE